MPLLLAYSVRFSFNSNVGGSALARPLVTCDSASDTASDIDCVTDLLLLLPLLPSLVTSAAFCLSR